MRKTFVALTAMALVGSAAMFVAGPRLARAQGGGTVEVDVKYNGAPVVEKLKVKKDMTEKFEKPEIIKLTCDVHSWMQGWVAVVPGIAAVTDGNGVAKLENVPAGKQKIEVWHETLGKQDKDVDVKAGQTTKVTFEMKGK